MSLLELHTEFEAATERKRDEHDARIVLAYNIVTLERQKKLPQLRKLLSRPNTPQTHGEMLSALQTLSGVYGGKVG